MENKDIKKGYNTCPYCSTILKADKDFSFGVESNIYIKTVRCPRCQWVRMAHTSDWLEVWETLERYTRAIPKKHAILDDLGHVVNNRGVPSEPNKKECGCDDSCPQDCSTEKGCGGCKH